MATKIDPDAALVRTEDKVRAEAHLERIKTGLVDAPDLLAKFIRHEEWKLLGYMTLEDCFEKSGLREAVVKGETSRKVVVDALRKSGFTVKQIAGKLEISSAQVSRIGSGKTGNESRDKRKLEGEDEPSGVTSDVTGNPELELLGRPEPLPEPDKTLKPTKTFTPGEVADRVYDESTEGRFVEVLCKLPPARLESLLLRIPIVRRWRESALEAGQLRMVNDSLLSENRRLEEANEELKRYRDEDLGRERMDDDVMPGSGY